MFHERRADPAMESTGQAPSWRPGVSTYRCFLPDLTGFAGSRRTRPNRPNPSQALKEILTRPPAFGKRERPHFLPGNRIASGEKGNHAYNMVLEGIASAGPAARANNHKSFRVAACMISTRFETTTTRSFAGIGSRLRSSFRCMPELRWRGRTWGGDTKTRGYTLGTGRDLSLRTPFHRPEDSLVPRWGLPE